MGIDELWSPLCLSVFSSSSLTQIFDWLVHYYLDDLCFKHYIVEVKYPDIEARRKRSYTLVKWAYSIFYYLVTSMWAYKIMIGTTFMPTWLGGLGSPYTMGDHIPNIPQVTL